MGIRTPDIQLAKLTLYQLSYTPLSLNKSLYQETGPDEAKTNICAARC
jgi:hypothetical protein